MEPKITFFGVLNTNKAIVDPVDMDGIIPIYQRPSAGFTLVVEGRPGGTRAAVGTSVFNSKLNDPTVLPDLQIIASNNLGNGSFAVCDDSPDMPGGVPGVPDFAPTQMVADAINDLACRFLDGSGTPGGRGPNDACIVFEDDPVLFHFKDPTSTVEFCGEINQGAVPFPKDETLVSVRLRDIAGHLSAVAQLIIRVPG